MNKLITILMLVAAGAVGAERIQNRWVGPPIPKVGSPEWKVDVEKAKARRAALEAQERAKQHTAQGRDVSKGGALALAQSRVPKDAEMIRTVNSQVKPDNKHWIWICNITYKVK